MSYIKNKAGQKFSVLAANNSGHGTTGDAGNITAKISLDFGAAASLSDTNPTELDATNFPGVYVFDLTQAETDADVLTIKATSTTASVSIDLVTIDTVDARKGYTDGPLIGRVISDGTTEATVTKGQVIKGIVLD